ncbi:MAG: hypothetical protein ACFE9S_04620 [Candidatus Hermodarchaeota archaeon]
MSKSDSSSLKVKLKIQVNNLISIYEQKAECGIFFKLEADKSPLEILGVLDFLKDRIKKWGNTNIFSYQGNLFREGPTLVVGARDSEEALSIIFYIYLTNIVDNEQGIDYLIKKLGTSSDLEDFLRTQISDNMENGYPPNPSLEIKLIEYLNGIVRS